MKKLGVIGGLGPMATVHFLKLVTEMTDASADQEHIEVILHSIPMVPDRTAYILGKSTDSPLPLMLKAAKELCALGVDIIAIPCVTAHYFIDTLSDSLDIPIIDGVGGMGSILVETGTKKVALLATDGTVRSGFLQRSLGLSGIDTVLPDKRYQDHIMSSIYSIKSGKDADMSVFREMEAHFREIGVERIILGCTELSLLKEKLGGGSFFLDVTEVMAREAVLYCGRLKKEYTRL